MLFRSALCAAHVKALLDRQRWYLGVRQQLMIMAEKEMAENRGITSKKAAGLFEVFNPPVTLAVPTGTLRTEPLINKERKAVVPDARKERLKRAKELAAAASSSTSRPAAASTGSVASEVAASLRSSMHSGRAPAPDTNVAPGSFVMVSSVPDATLHEHLWLDHVNERVVELFGEGVIPPLTPLRQFDDEIGRAHV